MKLYSTKFNLKKKYSALDVANAFRSWIDEKNYIEVPEYKDSLNISVSGERRAYRTLFLQKERVLAGKFSMTEQGVEWITTFTFNEETKTFVIALDKKKDDASVQFNERFAIPHFASIMIEYADVDVGLPVTIDPLELDKKMADTVAPIIKGDAAANLPLVLMSIKGNGEMTADPGFIADDLKGTAHVIASLDAEDDLYLTAATKGLYKNNGIVSIYFAGSKFPVIFSPEDMSSEAFRHKIRNTIFGRARVECRKPLETWDGVLETLTYSGAKNNEEQIKTLQEQIEKLKEENETWTQLVDEETARSTQQIERLNNTCREQEKELMILQAKLDAKCNQKNAILYAGDIEEFFPNEQREFVISAVQTAVKNTEKSTRRLDVLTSVAEANASDGILEEKKAEVESIFNGKKILSDREWKQLEEIGFTVAHPAGHYKVSYHGDERYMKIIGATPSDVRAMKNNCRNLIKGAF